MFVLIAEKLVRYAMLQTLNHLIHFGFVTVAKVNMIQNAMFAEEVKEAQELQEQLEMELYVINAISLIFAQYVKSIYNNIFIII